MDADYETDLKLAVSEAAWSDFSQAVIRAGARRESKTKTLRSVYFDTEDTKLRRSGFTLCIRSDGENNIQAAKSSKLIQSGRVKGEWENSVQASRPIAEAIENTPLSKLLSPKDLEKLRPAFTVDVERDTYLLDSGEATIGIALDKGVVRHGYTQQAFSEAEFELRRGSPQDLFTFARAVGADVPAIVSLTTKSERGYRLGTGTSGQPVMRIDYSLRRNMDAAEIARSITHPCLAALFENLAMLMAGAGGEALHQSRVCVRRLRALLSLLGSAFGWQDEHSVRAELKWLSDLLGGARELDVFAKSALAPAAEANPDAPGFEPLREAFQQRRDQAYATVVEALHTPRLLGLSLNLAGCFDGRPNAAPPSKDTKLQGKNAALQKLEKELRRRLKALVKGSRSIDRLAPAKRHRIRIQAKKLRYMLEPFTDLCPQKRLRKVTALLQAIQDELGDINDDGINRALALAHASGWLAGHDGGQSSLFAAGIVVATCHGRRPESLNKAAAARERLARASALEFG